VAVLARRGGSRRRPLMVRAAPAPAAVAASVAADGTSSQRPAAAVRLGGDAAAAGPGIRGPDVLSACIGMLMCGLSMWGTINLTYHDEMVLMI
jgi:hypothetical protein